MNKVYFPGDILDRHDLMTRRKRCQKRAGSAFCRTIICQHPPLSSHSVCGAEAEAQLCALLTLPLTHRPVWGVGQGASRVLQLKLRNVSVQISRGTTY